MDFPPCLPFGIPIDAAHRAGTQWDSVTYPVETTQFVPLFAYEAILNVIGAAVLLFVIRRFGPRLFAGDAALLYIMWYGAVRTVLELYRVNNWTILGAADGHVARDRRVRPRPGLARHSPPPRLGLADDPAR